MINFELSIKDEGFDHIVGIDEAGRGPLAGPVVASAVLVKDYHFTAKIADSKKISARQREAAFHEILDKACVGVGIISEAVIDRINILEATYLAMNNAAARVWKNPDRNGLVYWSTATVLKPICRHRSRPSRPATASLSASPAPQSWPRSSGTGS